MDTSRLAARIAFAAVLLSGLCSIATAQDAATEAETAGPPVESPLAKAPETAEEYFDATVFMLKLGKPQLAGYYLTSFLDMDPDDTTLLKLRDKYGTSTFLELVLVEEIETPATKLSARLQQAVRNHVSDPAFFPSLLKKLSGTGRSREEAIDELRYLGPYAIPPMLVEIQAPRDASPATLTYAMSRLGDDAVAPLMGTLASPEERVRIAAIEVLGIVGGEDEAVWLQSFAFSETSSADEQSTARTALARIYYKKADRTDRLSGYGAATQVLNTAILHLTNRYEWDENEREDGLRSIWSWDATTKTVAEHLVSDQFASLFHAEQLARQATQLAPQREEPAVVLLVTLMARDQEQVGWSNQVPVGPGTAHDLAVSTGANYCLKALEFAREQGIVSAQLVTLQALALNGSADLLAPINGHDSEMIQALDSPEPRVQFAAARTILSWKPRKGFKGARRVVEIMARALHSEDTPSTVVIDPNSIRCSETAGLFEKVGFDGIQAQTGMDGFREAVGRGHVELAVLHPNTIRWELTDTVANFRKDARTARLPIVIYGPPELREKVRHLTSTYQHVAYVDESATTNDLQRQLRPFLAQVSPPPLTMEQRSAQIKEALYWIRRMAETGEGIFDLEPVETALSGTANNPEYAEDAIYGMSVIPTKSAQKRFFTIAVAPAVGNEIRQQAALQLAFHIQRFGNKLDNMELEQLAVVAKSEPEPRVRTALTTVVGSLNPTPQASRKELLSFPASTGPIEPAQATP
ncbi:MAG: hypothetical protein KDA69_03495 [Planctomycetaceae bacterium]|nr:hypothetical protein [Planctomycetaceae bacterium]